mgnify:CR=1 FL=1
MIKIKFDEQKFLNFVDEKLDQLADEVFANSQDIIIQKEIKDTKP